jgi:hypothetical protein
VTVAAGATTATFIVTTVSAGSSTIAASYSGASQSAALTVTSAPATPSLLSIALDSPTVVGGGSVNGTVALTSAAPAGGAVVSLQSSDAGVAMIPSSVTVPAGATNASFTVTTRETGGEFRITLTGSYSGTSRSVLLVVAGTPPPLALVSLSISPSTIVGGGIAQGTATLNQMAPSGGTVVTLSSDAPAVANVPGSVTVTAGASAVTFPVVSSNTTAVRTATISASYNNVTRTATLTVNPALVATFVVSGPSGSDTCKLLTPGTADCTFDGRPSSGPIVAWEFTYLVGSQSVTLTTGTGQLSPTFPGCSFFPAPSSVPPGATFLPMEVRLKVRDSAGAASGETVNRNVRVLPNAQCGFGF